MPKWYSRDTGSWTLEGRSGSAPERGNPNAPSSSMIRPWCCHMDRIERPRTKRPMPLGLLSHTPDRTPRHWPLGRLAGYSRYTSAQYLDSQPCSTYHLRWETREPSVYFPTVKRTSRKPCAPTPLTKAYAHGMLPWSQALPSCDHSASRPTKTDQPLCMPSILPGFVRH